MERKMSDKTVELTKSEGYELVIGDDPEETDMNRRRSKKIRATVEFLLQETDFLARDLLAQIQGRLDCLEEVRLSLQSLGCSDLEIVLASKLLSALEAIQKHDAPIAFH